MGPVTKIDVIPATQNPAKTQYLLGLNYEHGRNGFIQDKVKAVHLYTFAANQGDCCAQHKLAHHTPNKVDAANWLSLSAAQGCIDGLRTLGIYFHRGAGVEQNDLKAKELFSQAALKGDYLAKQIESDLEKAITHYNLGIKNENGLDNIVKDEKLAIAHYQLAAKENHILAHCRLGKIYANGLCGIAKNDALAVKHFKLATSCNHAEGQFNLGLMNLEGRGGLDKDSEKAMTCFQFSAAKGHKGANCQLAYLYTFGLDGVAKDPIKASEHIQKALHDEMKYVEANQEVLTKPSKMQITELLKNEIKCISEQLEHAMAPAMKLYQWKVGNFYELSISSISLTLSVVTALATTGIIINSLCKSGFGKNVIHTIFPKIKIITGEYRDKFDFSLLTKLDSLKLATFHTVLLGAFCSGVAVGTQVYKLYEQALTYLAETYYGHQIDQAKEADTKNLDALLKLFKDNFGEELPPSILEDLNELQEKLN